ncbi:UNVERIFIED_CONTAM: Structural maintenance of chromosomes protein 5 [Sesamum radiatum]|uniref:Structural maintenance of chromosomes protein 5 n=1 Tax=Sesamum radiatum TaxID=300843 RepID=A0AAW2VBL3_SESRA
MAEEPKPKRPKISRGDDDYVPGNITKIELCNFMTFNKLTCKPGSRLNLVIGPNGSGKSSLVCAIALGLGGEPQLLGRATSIGAYVKRGEESGYIKISLRGESKEEPITITRKIDTRNKSEWVFNGKAVGKKDIIEVIQRFNIQVNNLTQFRLLMKSFLYAQRDIFVLIIVLASSYMCLRIFVSRLFEGRKVIKFLILESWLIDVVQLLEETEKAVGDPQLPIQHQALITKSQELKKFQRAVESNKGSLDQLKALNAELERDVERVRQREDLLAKAESMRKKLPWLKYDVKKAEYIELKNQEKDAKMKLDEAAKGLNELREPIERQKGERAKQEAALKKMNGLLDNNMKKRMQLSDNYNRLGVLIQGKYNEVEDLRRQEESRQQRISKAKEDLATAEAELANLPPYEPPKHKMEQLSARIMELEEAAKEIRFQKKEKEKHLSHHKGSSDSVRIGQSTFGQLSLSIYLTILKAFFSYSLYSPQRLREMENVNNKRLQALKNSGAEKIFEAYHWVQEHRDKFNKEVYGPVLLEVNVANRFHADYLEGHVANYIWKAFITQDSEDRDLLVKNLRSFDVPVINHVRNEGGRREPFQETDEMRKLGISSRLDQVFEAPHAVKEVLIGQFGLDHSYIGSRETDEKADLVFRLGIMDVWTPENHYRWLRSRYGNHVSGNVESVDRSRLLLCNLDVKEIESVKLRQTELEETVCTIDGNLRALQTALRQKEDEAAELQREREEIVNIIQSEKKRRREMEHLVNQKRMKLKSIEREDDPDAAIAKLTDQVKELKIQQFQCAIEIKNLLTEAVAYRRSFAEANMCCIEHEAKIKEMESNAKQQEKFALQASVYFDECKNATEYCRQQLSVAKKHAESIAPITPELQQAFLEVCVLTELLMCMHGGHRKSMVAIY